MLTHRRRRALGLTRPGQVAAGVPGDFEQIWFEQMRAGPVPATADPSGYPVGEHVDERRFDAARVGAGAEVLGQRLMVEAVGGAAGFGGLDHVGPGGAPQPGDVLIGVGVAGDPTRQGGPDVLPGQPLALGEGQRSEQVARPAGVRTESSVEVGAHRVARQLRQAGPPRRVGRIRRPLLGRERATHDPRDQE